MVNCVRVVVGYDLWFCEFVFIIWMYGYVGCCGGLWFDRGFWNLLLGYVV